MGSPILGSSHIFLFAHDNFTQRYRTTGLTARLPTRAVNPEINRITDLQPY